MISSSATSFSLLTLLLIGNLNICAGREITSNIAGGKACPGEEVVYTCVSIGTSQRWLVQDADGVQLVELVFTSGQSPGSRREESPFTFTLVSTSYYQFESTVSFVADASLHNAELECTGLTTPALVTVQITGLPTSPQNLQNEVKEYQSYSSSLLFTWDPPSDDSLVDYYQYQLIKESDTLAYNTTNTSVVYPEIPYNKNVTFSVIAVNCVGDSTPLRKTVTVVGCYKLENFSANNSSSNLSHAPGTELLLSCNNNGGDFIVTCQENGLWQPDPATLMCSLGTGDLEEHDIIRMPSQATSGKESSASDTFLIPIYVLTAVVSFVLCTLSGVVALCVWRARKRRKREELRSSIGASNRVYDDICTEPIYDVIKLSDVSPCDMKFPLSTNEAYTTVNFKEINFTSLEGEFTNKEVANPKILSETEFSTLMDNNCSYQTTTSLLHTGATIYSDSFTNSNPENCGKHKSVDSSVKNSQQFLPERTYSSMKKEDKHVFNQSQGDDPNEMICKLKSEDKCEVIIEP